MDGAVTGETKGPGFDPSNILMSVFPLGLKEVVRKMAPEVENGTF